VLVVAPTSSAAPVVEKGVPSEVLLEGVSPRERSGARPSLLSQDGEEGSRDLPQRAWSKQPKVPHSALVMLRNVLSPTVNEFLQRALYLNP
jgi:hypothetical protein